MPRLAVICLFLIGLPARAEDQAAAYQTAVESAVWIMAVDRNWDVSFGSGVMIDQKDGFIVTAYHVISPDRLTIAYLPQRGKDGEIIGDTKHYIGKGSEIHCVVVATDPARDLALLRWKIPQTVGRSLPMAARSARPGESLFTIGNAAHPGTLFRFAGGNCRQVYADSYRFEDGQQIAARVVEVTIPLNGGDSGGMIVNTQGELVGINSAVVNGRNQVHKGIDISEIRAFVQDARKPKAK